MSEKEYLINELKNIKVALNGTSDRLRQLVTEAESKGLHIDSEFEVHGDLLVLHANNELIRQITKLGQETIDLVDQLSEVEHKLSH